MPQPNIIQFSLNEEQRETLRKHSLEGESLGLTAKRLLLISLGYELSTTSQSKQSIDDRLESIEAKLSRINARLESLKQETFRDSSIIAQDLKTLRGEVNTLMSEANVRGWFES